jgi:hypothetical protein
MIYTVSFCLLVFAPSHETGLALLNAHMVELRSRPPCSLYLFFLTDDDVSVMNVGKNILPLKKVLFHLSEFAAEVLLVFKSQTQFVNLKFKEDFEKMNGNMRQ